MRNNPKTENRQEDSRSMKWEKFHDATIPVFEELYSQVFCGNETQRSIGCNSHVDYREKLEKELQTMCEYEVRFIYYKFTS